LTQLDLKFNGIGRGGAYYIQSLIPRTDLVIDIKY